MSNELNRISHTLSAEELTDIKNIIKSISIKMPFLVDLAEDDVLAFNKISDGDKVFIADCMTEAQEADGLLPPYFKPLEIAKDDTLNDQLYEIEDMLFEVYQRVRRNRMLAADEAYSGVSTFYNLMKAAANSKISKAIGIYKRLQSYHQKKVETAKATKKKIEAAKESAKIAAEQSAAANATS
jgi:hypothetical protein